MRAVVALRVSVTVAVAATIVGSPLAQAKVRWFHSPSKNIECQVSSSAAQGTAAYCQSFSPARSATLRRNGRTHVCRGMKCLGNGPENAFTLHYGDSVRVGPFCCKSLRRGMRCKVVKSGRGFLINTQGVHRF